METDVRARAARVVEAERALDGEEAHEARLGGDVAREGAEEAALGESQGGMRTWMMR